MTDGVYQGFTKIRFLVTLTCSALFLGASISFFLYPASVIREYNLVATTADNVPIMFDVYEPAPGIVVGTPKKAVILGHGVMVNKEVMKVMTIELAQSGFVVASLDFRSHGRSEGDFNFISQGFNVTKILGGGIDLREIFRGEVLAQEIAAVKTYLANRGDVDINSLGYMGYSMGGGAGFAALENDPDFHAMVGLAPLADYVRTNLTRPPNLLVVVGKYDQGITLSSVLKVMQNKTGHAVAAADIEAQILNGGTWEWAGGSFAAETAARLYLDPLAEHFLAPWNANFIGEAKAWFERALLDRTTLSKAIVYPTIFALLLCQVAGGMGLFFGIAEPVLDKYARKGNRAIIPPQVLEGSSSGAILKGVILHVLVLSFPCMLLILPLYFAPLVITTFELMLILGPSMAVLVGVRRLTKKELGIRQIYRNIAGTTCGRNVLLGLALGILFYLIALVSVGQVFSLIPSLGKWPWVPLYFAVAFFCYANFILFFQGVLQERLQPKGTSALLKMGLFNYGATVAVAAFILFVPCMLIGNYFIAMFFIPMLLLLLAAAFIGTLFYARTRDVVLPSLATAVLVCLMMTTLSMNIQIWEFV